MSAESKRDRRRREPIHGYIGANGSGKTAAMVHDTIPTLDAGVRQVLSTVRLIDFRNPRPCDDPACRWEGHPEHGAPHPSWVPFTDWRQLLETQRCDVLMDEITGIAGSRDTTALPSEVSDMFHQQRRGDRVIRWTAPSWKRSDVQLRETTQAVTVCRGRFSVPVEGRLWRQNRLFSWTTYDVKDLGDDQVPQLAVGAATRTRTLNDIDKLIKQWVWGPGSEMFAAYDTFAPVLRVGHVVAVSGRCLDCGLPKKRSSCACHEDAAAGPRRGARSVSRATDKTEEPRAGSPSGVRAVLGLSVVGAMSGETSGIVGGASAGRA